MRELYKAKGYSDEWIEKRVRGIAIRDELTNEWKKRGVKEQREYSILTAEISRATFGMTPAEYKQFKSLDKPADNLRDLEKKSGKSIASKENYKQLPEAVARKRVKKEN